MTVAESAYYSFLFACAAGASVTLFLAIYAPFELRRQNRIFEPLNARHVVNRWITVAGLVSAVILCPLFANGAHHVYQLTPDEFVREFNEVRNR